MLCSLTQRSGGSKATVVLGESGLRKWLSGLIGLSINALRQLLQGSSRVSSASKAAESLLRKAFTGHASADQSIKRKSLQRLGGSTGLRLLHI